MFRIGRVAPEDKSVFSMDLAVVEADPFSVKTFMGIMSGAAL